MSDSTAYHDFVKVLSHDVRYIVGKYNTRFRSKCDSRPPDVIVDYLSSWRFGMSPNVTVILISHVGGHLSHLVFHTF